jgi:hypothetical protein
MSSHGVGVLGCLVVIFLIVCFGVFIGGAMLQYIIEFWASRNAEQPVDVAYWKCCLLGLPLGWNVAIPAVIITWIVDLSTQGDDNET